ncbi:MAG TPA: RNA polymerase sigma factor region1.1 domain-containing protein, partial [Methyloceanibacter sp.]|nr:RNA polymerase sigma factor region1.1 domain-containing protein [Methyloceanibacter sp.]
MSGANGEMANSRKSKPRVKSGGAARKKVQAKAPPPKRPLKAKAPQPKLKAAAATAKLKAPLKDEPRALPKGVLPGKAGKIPQKMDKAALKKALLAERINRAQLKAKVDGKRSTRGLTAKERALVKEFERKELSPADAEARRTRLKNLIVLGKERSYLTYAEINDHLPDDMLDAELIENIIGMINDMGIQVYDEAPDAETLLMSEATPAAPTDDVEEAAEAAVSTLDSEFGRTTDPVRMYM